MIKNEREYRISRAQAERFRHALARPAESLEGHVEIHPQIRRAEAEALEAQLLEREKDIADYEALRSGTAEIVAAKTISDLPQLLIRARIAAGLDQSDLALRLGLKVQQIQRYEATDYSSASLSRLIEV